MKRTLCNRLFRFRLVGLLLVLACSAATAGEPMTIVTLGDSITKGVRTGVKTEETFSAILETSLKKQKFDVSVVNVGIGGERTDQALKRLNRDVIAKGPALVVIMYGTNDSYVDIGAKASRITAAEYEQNLRRLIARLRGAEIVPVLMTEPRWGDRAAANGLGEHPNIRLQRYVEVCRRVAKQLKTPLVDNFKVWSAHNSQGTDVGTWTTDQCHPNPPGHQVIAKAMLPVIAETLAKLSQRTK